MNLNQHWFILLFIQHLMDANFVPGTWFMSKRNPQKTCIENFLNCSTWKHKQVNWVDIQSYWWFWSFIKNLNKNFKPLKKLITNCRSPMWNVIKIPFILQFWKYFCTFLLLEHNAEVGMASTLLLFINNEMKYLGRAK